MGTRDNKPRRDTPKKGSTISLEDLPTAELEVLACLWREQMATARQLREIMKPYRPMSHGAIVTLLKRLEEKRLVSKEKANVGKAFVYRADHAPESTYKGILNRMRERIFGGSLVSMMASLFDGNPPNQDELRALDELVRQLKGKPETRRRIREG
ncbi:MAG: hypothetical protein AMXMBFR84_11110 [Candidatus Hydrogenedentota bacterium]